MSKEELLKALKDKQTENNYTIIINKSAANKEFMILQKEHLKGAMAYYPQKEFEIILQEDNLKNILEKIEELELTDYDVIFIDNFDIEAFYLIEQYALTFTGVKSIVIDSHCRNKEAKAPKKILENIKTKLEEENTNYQLSLFEELILGKNIEELKEFAKEKNLEIKQN